MTPERWRRVEEVFQAALELDGGARAAYLERACAGDGDLAARVARLLAADRRAADFLEATLASNLAAFSGAIPELEAGTRLGHYELLGEVGRGGMSVVYRARRADEEFRQEVAIKVLQPAMRSQDVLERFRDERQILARLDHPHVARLFDGGTTAEGLPYFVMEYVEGTPIDRYCEAGHLPVAERLRLFQTICGAVHSAHQKLIVHRDIKPSNILVTAEGEVKLLDFGIAKVLAEDGADASATAGSAGFLTPEYASPEQLLSRPVTTATDVYSLGVLLYELLAGRRPFAAGTLPPHELARRMVEEDPQPPSAAAPSRRLPEDLDNVVLMALRKAPERRYGSALQLAEDVERFLRHLPVRARPDTFAYRAGKFVRRHRLTLGLAAAGFLLLAAFAGTSGLQAARIAAERDRAERLVTMFEDLFRITDPGEGRGSEITVREVLDRGVETVEAELSSEPELAIRMLTSLGDSYRNLGLHDEARPLLERALSIVRERSGDDSPAVADVLARLADLELTSGDLEAAGERFRRVLALRRELLGERHPQVADTWNDLAVVLHEQGDFLAAEAAYGEALDLRRQIFGEDHPEVAQVLSNLGFLLSMRGDAAAAEPLIRRALTIREARLDARDMELVDSLRALCQVLKELGQLEEAETLGRRVLAIYEEVLEEDHPYLANAANDLGLVLDARGDAQGAGSQYRRALAIYGRVLPADHLHLSFPLTNLGHLLARHGAPGEGEPLLRRALAIREQAAPGGSHWSASTRAFLGECLIAQGRFAEAVPLLAGAHDWFRRERGDDHPRTRRSREALERAESRVRGGS